MFDIDVDVTKLENGRYNVIIREDGFLIGKWLDISEDMKDAVVDSFDNN